MTTTYLDWSRGSAKMRNEVFDSILPFEDTLTITTKSTVMVLFLYIDTDRVDWIVINK